MEKVYFVAFGEPMTEVFGPYPLGTAEDDPEVLAELDRAGYGGVYCCVQAPGAARALTLALNQHRGDRGGQAASNEERKGSDRREGGQFQGRSGGTCHQKGERR